MLRKRQVGIGLIAILTGLLTGCSSGQFTQELMRAPTVYEDGGIDPLTVEAPAEVITYKGILYATSRVPSQDENSDFFYSGESDAMVRVGVAHTELVDESMTWEQFRSASRRSEREEEIEIRVTKIDELGVIESTRHPFVETEMAASTPDADESFAALINNQLQHTDEPEILVYVHGYRVPFDDPILVATEFWHFMGYEGVTIAYSWPATESLVAYLRDTEAADNASREFRLFLKYLAANTDAKRINVLGYSAGTRMVVETLQDIAIEPADTPNRLGDVILVSSEVSRAKVGSLLADGGLDRVDALTFYVSSGDAAVDFTDWLFDRTRIGSFKADEVIRQETAQFLLANPNLRMIDASNAKDAVRGNGHGYFRSSPWVSSDILATLDFHLDPAQRGLAQDSTTGFWQFPNNYPERLRSAILETLE